MTHHNQFYGGNEVLVKYEDNWHYVWFWDDTLEEVRWFCLEECDGELLFDRFENAYTQDIDRIVEERDAEFVDSDIYEEWILNATGKVSRRYLS